MLAHVSRLSALLCLFTVSGCGVLDYAPPRITIADNDTKTTVGVAKIAGAYAMKYEEKAGWTANTKQVFDVSLIGIGVAAGYEVALKHPPVGPILSLLTAGAAVLGLDTYYSPTARALVAQSGAEAM